MTVAPAAPATPPELAHSPEVDHPRPHSDEAGAGTAPSDVFAEPGSETPLWPELGVENKHFRHSEPSGAGEKRKWPPEVLTPAEVTALVAACSPKAATGIRNRALMMLLYRSGLRISEALALTPGDLDFTAHDVKVRHGKGDKFTMRGFHPSCDDALHRWIDTRRGRGLARRDVPLFCTLKGGPVLTSYIRTLMPRLQARAGIEHRVHAHALRHTFAVELDRAGKSTAEISKLLGHSSVAVTARYLDHLTNRQAVESLVATDLPDIDIDW